MKQQAVPSLSTLCAFAVIGVSLVASHARAQEPARRAKTYSYATTGITELSASQSAQLGVKSWKLLLDESNLGGTELELSELVFPAGAVVAAHHHKAVEIFYVLSGTLGHEVNGTMQMLTPGMVGVVRPEDSVRHVVPKTGDVKLLVIWAPAGEEAKVFFGQANKIPAEHK
jgi:quercetin dioxygenase-like cupin family protein